MGSFARRTFVKVFHSGKSSILCKDICGFSLGSLRLNHLSTHHPLYEKSVSDILRGSNESDSRLPRLTDESARRLAKNLTAEDRSLLLKEIQQIKGDEAIMKYQGSLASLRWRSRIGRSSSLGESDPSGRFCVIPTNWLKQRLATSIPKPTPGQLIHTFLFNSIPFIGFGFLDNVIMITAGDYIEASMGVALGISTMAAAALGNAVSDVAGIGSAFYVELIAMRIGVPAPTMTAEQQDLKISHWFSNIGRAFGVALGCLLGMFPLFFLPGHNKEKVSAAEAAEAATTVVPVAQAESPSSPAPVVTTAASAAEKSADTASAPSPRLTDASDSATGSASSATSSDALVVRIVAEPQTSAGSASNQNPDKPRPAK